MDRPPVTGIPGRSAEGLLWRQRAWPLYLVWAAVAAGSFVRTVGYPFVYDDRYIIERHPAVTSSAGWWGVLTARYWPPESAVDVLYRPLTLLTLKINYILGGGRPAGFRVANLLLHVLTTVLVAALARRLWERNSAAWVAGLLFAVHPLHAEALGLVVGRAELLATVLVTWMLCRHLNAGGWHGSAKGEPLASPLADPCHPTPGPYESRWLLLRVPPLFRTPPPPALFLHRPPVLWRYHLTTAVLFLFALASKEHALIAWPALLLLDVWKRARKQQKEPWGMFCHRLLASYHLGLILALAAFLFMRWVVYGGLSSLPPEALKPYANPLEGQPLVVQAATPLALLWLVLRQWLVAAPLCPIWSVDGFDLPSTFFRADVLAGATVAVAVLGVLAVGPRRSGRAWLPVGWFTLAVLIPCHFIPAANWLYAERWMYLPSVFLAVGCGGLARWVPRCSVAASTVVATLFLTTTLSYQRSWSTHERLFEAVVRRQPYSYHGLIGLLAIRAREGRLTESACDVDRLLARFPNTERAWYYRVLLAGELRDWDTAAEALPHWDALRPPETPPPTAIERILDQLQQHRR